MLVNTVKLLLKISDSPKYSSLFALSTAICQNSTPPFFPRTVSRNKQLLQIYMHWVNEKAMSMQIMYGAPLIQFLTDIN